jgi:hypothetical protein
MPPLTLAGNANIANDAADSASRREYADALLPHFIQLVEEFLVALDIPKLRIISGRVLFQGPIGWRCDHQVDRGVRNP